MDAEVEVSTAKATATAVMVFTLTTVSTFEQIALSSQVLASTSAVPSQGSHSISAVAPDALIFRKELAKA